MASNEGEVDEVLTEIKALKKRLKQIEKASRRDVDDQLFFGIVFSFLLLFITIPTSDVVLFLEKLGVPLEYAPQTTNGIKAIGIGSMLISSLFRYQGALLDKRTSMKKRYHSIASMFFGFYFMLFLIVANTSTQLILSLGGMWISMPLPLLGLIYFVLGFFERKILEFYNSKNLIMEKDTKSDISIAFSVLSFSLFSSIILVNQVSIFVPFLSGELARIMIFLLLLLALCIFLMRAISWFMNVLWTRVIYH
jgi:hypothetical protein